MQELVNLGKTNVVFLKYDVSIEIKSHHMQQKVHMLNIL